MKFRKFRDFLEERKMADPLNRNALSYERKLAELNGRFDNPREAERVIQMAGYASVGEFLSDPDEMKWCKLKIPGQENYRK